MSIRKITTSVQLSEEQMSVLEKILIERTDRPSIAKVLREAFDLYVQTKYPNLLK